jgi:hypothetical protein
VEVCTAIIAACCPCLKPLVKGLLRGSLYNNTYQLNSQTGYFSQDSKSRKGTIPGNRSATGNFGPKFGSNNGIKTFTSASGESKMDVDNISETSFPPQRDQEDIKGIRKIFQVSVSSGKADSVTDIRDRL